MSDDFTTEEIERSMAETEREIKKRIALFKKHLTKEAKPVCCNCDEEAEFYDVCEGDLYCNDCLEVELRDNIDFLLNETEPYARTLE